jgi:CcmD family protein
MIRSTVLVSLFAAIALLAVATAPAWAQQATGLPSSGMAQQSLRPYWHVFIAYAVTIVLVLGWVVSISRRLKDVEERLKE